MGGNIDNRDERTIKIDELLKDFYSNPTRPKGLAQLEAALPALEQNNILSPADHKKLTTLVTGFATTNTSYITMLKIPKKWGNLVPQPTLMNCAKILNKRSLIKQTQLQIDSEKFKELYIEGYYKAFLLNPFLTWAVLSACFLTTVIDIFGKNIPSTAISKLKTTKKIYVNLVSKVLIAAGEMEANKPWRPVDLSTEFRYLKFKFPSPAKLQQLHDSRVEQQNQNAPGNTAGGQNVFGGTGSGGVNDSGHANQRQNYMNNQQVTSTPSVTKFGGDQNAWQQPGHMNNQQTQNSASGNLGNLSATDTQVLKYALSLILGPWARDNIADLNESDWNRSIRRHFFELSPGSKSALNEQIITALQRNGMNPNELDRYLEILPKYIMSLRRDEIEQLVPANIRLDMQNNAGAVNYNYLPQDARGNFNQSVVNQIVTNLVAQCFQAMEKGRYRTYYNNGNPDISRSKQLIMKYISTLNYPDLGRFYIRAGGEKGQVNNHSALDNFRNVLLSNAQDLSGNILRDLVITNYNSFIREHYRDKKGKGGSNQGSKFNTEFEKTADLGNSAEGYSQSPGAGGGNLNNFGQNAPVGSGPYNLGNAHQNQAGTGAQNYGFGQQNAGVGSRPYNLGNLNQNQAGVGVQNNGFGQQNAGMGSRPYNLGNTFQNQADKRVTFGPTGSGNVENAAAKQAQGNQNIFGNTGSGNEPNDAGSFDHITKNLLGQLGAVLGLDFKKGVTTKDTIAALEKIEKNLVAAIKNN